MGHIRGQVPAMRQMFSGLASGLAMAVVVVFLMLTAYFQSIKLALVSVATTPAVVAGVAFALYITNTTLNIQSFMGAIMAVGVAVANAILLVAFAEKARQTGIGAADGARIGAEERLRAILMTSCAMIVGMIPLALGLGARRRAERPAGPGRHRRSGRRHRRHAADSAGDLHRGHGFQQNRLRLASSR